MQSPHRTGKRARQICAEILELAVNAANDYKKKTISPRHLQLAIRNDEELNKLLRNVTIASRGASAHSQCPSSQEDFRVVFHRTADHVSSLATHVSDTLTDRNVFGRIYLENHGKLFFGFFVVLLRVEDVSHLKKSQLGMCFLRWETRP